MQLFNVTGIMISYFVNYGMSRQITDPTSSAVWRIPFALQILPGALLLLIFFQNESPRWLVEKGRVTDAKRALCQVRALPEDDPALQEELEEIVADFEGKEKLSLGMQVKAACASKRMFYQSSMGVVLMFFQQWTGTNSINYYSPQIFQSVGLSSASAGLFATGIYGVVKVVFTSLALMFGVEQAGRKVRSPTLFESPYPCRAELTCATHYSGLLLWEQQGKLLLCSTSAATKPSTLPTRPFPATTSLASSASIFSWCSTPSVGALSPSSWHQSALPTTVCTFFQPRLESSSWQRS